ncbi:sulfotransferase family protein [Paraburkholderia antibiotica]|uniref:Sulfotransferase n=1 Tax=Paraburkholderia antibiotica TaxID=2728839 RepID=A0A7X9ZZD9_9BURK|nr:sulfotransferase [Paraburkholderia antibiotica]NML32815.1 sulfotransferase [Paraburkholderia antibiotica]
MESFPLFIVGSPRSGTTFLCSVLNAHPLIQLTNEGRVFTLLKDFLEVGCKRPDLLGESCRDRFTAFSRRTLGPWVERFYREELQLGAPIWGDKHPSYADPTVLSGRIGSIERLPRSGSCLHLIRELLPRARFIHIHRDPRHVANSLLHKRWTGSIEDGIRVWGQYVGEINAFFEEMPAETTLTVSYRTVIEAPHATATRIGHFLGLADASPISDFLISQRVAPTPFSDPVTDIGDLYLIADTAASDDGLLALAETEARRLGYAAA